MEWTRFIWGRVEGSRRFGELRRRRPGCGPASVVTRAAAGRPASAGREFGRLNLASQQRDRSSQGTAQVPTQLRRGPVPDLAYRPPMSGGAAISDERCESATRPATGAPSRAVPAAPRTVSLADRHCGPTGYQVPASHSEKDLAAGLPLCSGVLQHR